MHTERIESSLQARSWSFNRRREDASRQLVMLLDGAGEAETDRERHLIVAPALMWLGDLTPGRIRTQAGATGFRASVPGGLVAAAIGDQPESVDLRYLVDRDFVLSLTGSEDQAATLERCLTAVFSESRQPREGSTLLISALLRIVLVIMLRLAGGNDIVPSGIGEKAGLLQRFRQLVEMNFRSHWTVAQYAKALGISTDRLHAICSSGIGKPPKALISERLAQEAVQRLERSAISVQQLGISLGFGDPAHFSSFFKRMTGMAPGRYRAFIAQSRAEGRAAAQPSFSDWP